MRKTTTQPPHTLQLDPGRNAPSSDFNRVPQHGAGLSSSDSHVRRQTGDSQGHVPSDEEKRVKHLQKRRMSRAALVENDSVYIIAVPTPSALVQFIKKFTGFPLSSTIDTSAFCTSYFVGPLALLTTRAFSLWIGVIILFGFLVPGASPKTFFFFLPNLVWLAALIYFLAASYLSLAYVWRNADFIPRYTKKFVAQSVAREGTTSTSRNSSTATLSNEQQFAMTTVLPIYQPKNWFLRGIFWAWALLLPTFSLISLIGYWSGFVRYDTEPHWPEFQYQWFRACNLHGTILVMALVDLILSRTPGSPRAWWLPVLALLLYYCWLAIADLAVVKPQPYNNFGQSIGLSSKEAKVLLPVLPLLAIGMFLLFSLITYFRDKLGRRHGYVKGKKLTRYE